MLTNPRITIAICTFNRADYLRDTLNDLSDQTARDEEFEILVVNNNSYDNTVAVCREFIENHPDLYFRCVHEPRQGLSYARNRAAREAAAPAILYIDDDVHLSLHFVQTAIDYSEKYPTTHCAGGRIYVSFDGSEPGWIPGELMPMFGLHDLGNEKRRYPSSNFPRGGNMFIRRHIFDAFGYFNTKLGRTGAQLLGSEEKAFFDRIRGNGVELHYWPDLKLEHRIGPKRLERNYLKNQSMGIGRSERLRLQGARMKLAAKFLEEIIKTAGSFFLAAGYLLRGKKKSASFILVFRSWVLKGFLAKTQSRKGD